MALTKLLTPKTCYLVAQPLNKITSVKLFQWPWMSFLHLSTGSLAHSYCANCSSSPRFEGCLLPTAVFRSPHRCSMWFRSGLIASHFRTVQGFVLNHSWVLFEVFGVIVLLQDPWLSTETQLSDNGLNIVLQNALVISWFNDAMHTFKAPSARGSTTTPKHHWTSSMFDCSEGVLLFEGFILFSVNIEMMCFTKKF